tara:strand:- start:44 stop:520 length:477 start_codon:yes stop_codon:yes gene_type:complete
MAGVADRVRDFANFFTGVGEMIQEPFYRRRQVRLADQQITDRVIDHPDILNIRGRLDATRNGHNPTGEARLDPFTNEQMLTDGASHVRGHIDQAFTSYRAFDPPNPQLQDEYDRIMNVAQGRVIDGHLTPAIRAVRRRQPRQIFPDRVRRLARGWGIG